MNIKRLLRKEEGAISIEFLGILPFYFMFFLLLWQVVASGYAVIHAKSAVNNGAKNYAITKNINVADQVIRDTLGSNAIITYNNMQLVYLDANGNFEMTLVTDHHLIFVPDIWKNAAALSIEQKAIGRVMNP